MINLDELNQQELQEFIEAAEVNAKNIAKQLFPDQQGAVRAINHLVKYAKEKIELMKHASFNRQDKVKRIKDRCDNIYRTIPEFAQWNLINEPFDNKG